MPCGRLLSFEGLDGSGKSTQIAALSRAVEQRGIRVVTTREPGGTTLGEQVRALLLQSSERPMAAMAELALLFAARAQLVTEVIRPALADGAWVLCDRFIDSSEAYQGSGRGLGSEIVLSMHSLLNAGLLPDLTFLLRNDVEVSLARARRRASDAALDRFEVEALPFFLRTHQGFDRIAARDTGRVVVLDADQTPDAIHAQVLATLAHRFCADFARPLAVHTESQVSL